MKCTLLLYGLLTGSMSFSQMTISTSISIEEMVNDILLGKGLEVSNISYTGYPNAIGHFQMAASGQFDFQSGIVMCTGTVLEVDTELLFDNMDPTGPNDDDYSGVDNYTVGDDDLFQLAGGDPFYDSQNASVLEFDFIAAADTIQMSFVFGSEEYPEFVGTEFNDVFAVFLSGPGISGGYSNNAENVALLPSGEAVGINTINAFVNSDLFVDNTGGQYLQYNGYTRKLQFNKKIQQGQKYHMKIAISDMVDGVNDSGIFIDAKSLQTTVVGTKEIEIKMGVPNIVTQNDDQINEKFVLKNLEHFPNTEVKIFNRWGNEVFASSAYKNEWPEEKLTSGTYFYLINNHVDEPKYGFVQLVGN